MKRLLHLFSIAAVAVLSVPAHAHFVWLSFDGESVEMTFSEVPGENTPPELQSNVEKMTINAAIPMKGGESALSGSLAAPAGLLHGSYNYGVLDRSEQDRGVFLLIYHAKAARTPADALTPVGHAVEVFAEVHEGKLQVRVLHNGAPARAAELTISYEGVEEAVEFDTNAEGRATAPATEKGWIGIRAMVREDKAGELDGKAYTMIRHYATLNLPTK